MTDSFIKKPLNSSLCQYNYYYKQVHSTHDVARYYIENKRLIGFTVTAETQLKGRGRGKKSWVSPPGGLWTSLAIKPSIDIFTINIVPLLTAVAITEIFKPYKIDMMLKWPNDILIKGNCRKLGGILVESKTTLKSLEYLIIGIGLNVNTKLTQYPISLRNHIATIFEEYNIKIDLEELLNNLVQEIEKFFKLLNRKGPNYILEYWKKIDNIIGMDVRVKTTEKNYYGKAIDISPYGHLILETTQSKRITLSDGTLFLSDLK